MAPPFSPSKNRMASTGCSSPSRTASPAWRESTALCLRLADACQLLDAMQILHETIYCARGRSKLAHICCGARLLVQLLRCLCSRRHLPYASVHVFPHGRMLQEQARQDGGGDWRSHARRPRRPGPELVLHIDAAEGLQQVTGHQGGTASSPPSPPKQGLGQEAFIMCACWC